MHLIISSLLSILLIFVFINYKKIQSLNNQIINQLKNISIVDDRIKSIDRLSGMEYTSGKLLYTENYISTSFTFHSPIHDNEPFTKQISKYNRNWEQDCFGAFRRTGKIVRRHEGLDLYVKENTPLYPISDFGIVVEVSDDPNHEMTVNGLLAQKKTSVTVNYGKIVRILYPSGLESLFAHLNVINTKKGDLVRLDTVVGLTGHTGNITESGKPSHLHLEIRDRNNQAQDPYVILSFPEIELSYYIERFF